ncbi:hypothetical protein ONZ45_g9183 [Pleurotus djamor]|nr:hypothetical protein ONZ45_g9183 [Pleurotus djamor]
MSRSTLLKVHCIPRLRDNGSNWHAYKEQFMTHIESKKYSRVIEGYPFQKPKDLVPQDGEYYLESDMNVPLSGEQLEEHCGKLDEFKAWEDYVRGIIQETVGPLLLEQLQLFEAGNAQELWEHMGEMFEKRGNMAAVETLRKLQSLCCTDPSKVRAHVTEMWGYTEQLSAMGAPLSDIQFVTHLSASLPPSFQPLLSALDTTHNILNIPLTSTTLINKLFIEADTQTALQNMNSRTTTQPAAESSAMAATAGRGRGRGRGRSDRPPCENCKKKGHSKEKCWAKGGGAEGNAPEWWNPRKQSDGKEGALANVADQAGPNYALITTSDNADSTPATVTGTPEDIEDFDYALATSENPKHYGIIIDCGASRHFTPLRSKLLNYVEIEHEPLRTADGRMFKMIGKGNMEFFLPMGPGKPPTQVTLMNVYYSPNMAYTLVSVQTLTKKGFSLLFENDACTAHAVEIKYY